MSSIQDSAEGDAVTAFLLAEQRTGDDLVSAIDSILLPIRNAMESGDLGHSNGNLHTTAYASTPRTIAAHVATLMKGEIPAEWENLWQGPPDPLEFIQAATSRVRALKRLLVSHTQEYPLIGTSNATALHHRQAPVSICSFFSPGAFVSTLRQAAARAVAVSVDTLTLVTSWKPENLPSAAHQAIVRGGVQVSGMVLEGATFDGVALSAAPAGSPPRASVPPVTLVWVLPDVAKEAAESTLDGVNVLPVPVYLRSDRRSPVVQLAMPVRNRTTRQDFVIAGAAAFVSR